jgi:ABC-2 type transport system ATP-binding protein
MKTSAIAVEDLTRIYHRGKKGWFRSAKAASEFRALDHVSLEVAPGELFGLLGPNGAGKTTLIKILTTLLAPTSGSAQILGYDVVRQAEEVRPRINMVSGGESSGYGILTVRENLWLFSRIYGVPTQVIQERVEKLLTIVGLAEKADTRISHLSTGQRQKMNFCRGFITDPQLLFLDEPTLGLDVTSARAIRGFLRTWLAERPGRTLMLTTHYMAEAEELCDRIAIIDRGKVLACDTPDRLKRGVQQYPLFEIGIASTGDLSPMLRCLPGVQSLMQTDQDEQTLLKVAFNEERYIGQFVQELTTHSVSIKSLKKVEPTLEDVFLEVVGRPLTETPQP